MKKNDCAAIGYEDLTVISRSIIKTLNEIEPLSETQEMLMHGIIAGLMMSIRDHGLPHVINVLSKRFNDIEGS